MGTQPTKLWFRWYLCRWIPNRQLVVSRRRWESNPLQAALQAAATPCDLSVTFFNVPTRVRVTAREARDLHLDRVASTPHCSARTYQRKPWDSNLHSSPWQVTPGFRGFTEARRLMSTAQAIRSTAVRQTRFPRWIRGHGPHTDGRSGAPIASRNESPNRRSISHRTRPDGTSAAERT